MNHNETSPVYLGAHHVWGTPITIADDDRRRHLYIIGRPGAGKSRLMENLFLQDVYAGRGAAFIDPHGTSAARVLDYIPSYRHRDVVYFRPADLERPIGLNILQNVHPDHVQLVAQGIVGAFKSVWRDSWGPGWSAFSTMRLPRCWNNEPRRSWESFACLWMSVPQADCPPYHRSGDTGLLGSRVP
jgi:hypothetical protein